MTHLSGRIEAKPDGRLFESLWQIQQLLACIMQASVSGNPKDVPSFEVSAFLSKQFATSALIPMKGVLSLCFNDRIPISTWIDFHKLPEDVSPGDDSSADRLLNLAISVVFVNFYQKHKSWLHKNVNEHPSGWPEVLQFARLVRNAMAHNGCVSTSGKREVGAKWHHLAYGKADDGFRIIGPVLASGDLLILLVETSQELDRISAPVAP